MRAPTRWVQSGIGVTCVLERTFQRFFLAKSRDTISSSGYIYSIPLSPAKVAGWKPAVCRFRPEARISSSRRPRFGLLLFNRVMSSSGKWKNDGRILLDTYLCKRLKITELEGHGPGREEGGGVDELLGGVEFALGVDDLGAAFALGFGLLGHGAKHGFGEVDLPDLDGDDFDSKERCARRGCSGCAG